jgi:hypothetical protein
MPFHQVPDFLFTRAESRGGNEVDAWRFLSCYAKGKGPPWLEMEPLLKSFELAESGRGRRAYVDWLEARAANDGGEIDQMAQDALRRGWYLGEETFRDRLLDLVDKAKGVQARKRSTIRVCAAGSRGEGSRAADTAMRAASWTANGDGGTGTPAEGRRAQGDAGGIVAEADDSRL